MALPTWSATSRWHRDAQHVSARSSSQLCLHVYKLIPQQRPAPNHRPPTSRISFRQIPHGTCEHRQARVATVLRLRHIVFSTTWQFARHISGGHKGAPSPSLARRRRPNTSRTASKHARARHCDAASDPSVLSPVGLGGNASALVGTSPGASARPVAPPARAGLEMNLFAPRYLQIGACPIGDTVGKHGAMAAPHSTAIEWGRSECRARREKVSGTSVTVYKRTGKHALELGVVHRRRRLTGTRLSCAAHVAPQRHARAACGTGAALRRRATRHGECTAHAAARLYGVCRRART